MKQIDKIKDSLKRLAFNDRGDSNNKVVNLDDVLDELDELKSDLLHSVSERSYHFEWEEEGITQHFYNEAKDYNEAMDKFFKKFPKAKNVMYSVHNVR